MSDQDSEQGLGRPEPYLWELSSAESNTVAVLGVVLGEADMRSAAQAWPSFTKRGPDESR